ncbi:NADPH-dependent 7-cyano-7-deazaguanine reductase QueF [Psychrobium sp. 1_MG-2023]|uniref:NADPH-dependent 7-cyano-7-deazaguanine reductase QueF n=1 Tax=Psychrobium sp. 1_MG-2023 TaxID=3062624 RepID=UPI000C34F974|nr:NADPH-dependent 7-cyano-7-deazaguanine reductase QueF [Psychrobium sp. 1_MG-2023]MDP2562230.1 NADPH-dependent 7-cyano-7-deazaguanine reductase QueF [Psychrobium sp. 1_MG-2023]PKF57484.1 NADPH-dependent 7-cyano-7-deazaguanine reductase QueF [Alteromonadales bacterium alter-6D02]
MTTKSPYDNAPELASLTLGKQTDYDNSFDEKLLQAVPRALNRNELNLGQTLPFHGDDIWTGYELSWLNAKGKPVVAMANFKVPCQSNNLIESKSFKLYLNSYNQQRFNDADEVTAQLTKDLSVCAESNVTVEIILAHQFATQRIISAAGHCIDDLDITIDDYQFSTDFLAHSDNSNQPLVSETLHSNLLKSNCLITNQPDWGTVEISYHGRQIDHEALLRYLISFRQHNEFHEQCVERIFTDLMRFCHCDKLTVYARYTRRGGLDINPFRSNFEETPSNQRQARQ